MARGGSEFCRIIVILLPAFYCSWTAFQSTLRATSSWSTAPWSSSAEILPINDTSAFFDGRRQRREKVTVADEDYDCFRWNSDKWLAGPRLGNSLGYYSQETGISDFFAGEALPTAEAFERILQQQSLCGKESPFSSFLVTDQEEEQRQIRRWTSRLLFLAVHLHQHGPALPEARQRNNSPCQQLARIHGIGSFDFECPKSKFLVVSFYKNGIGANMRLAAVPALMAGLATGRIILFVNNAPTGPAFLQEPWMLASCERRDAQCFFLPASPCTITHEELASAYQLKRGEMRRIFRRGEVPEVHVNDRVLILHLSFRPQRQPENLREVLYNLSQTVVERVVASADSRLAHMLHKAAEAILNEEEPPTTTFNYYGANSAVFHSLLLYAMRPNPQSTMRMDEILAEILPPDFAADSSLGLPIRGAYVMFTAVGYDGAMYTRHQFRCRIKTDAPDHAYNTITLFMLQHQISVEWRANVSRSSSMWRQPSHYGQQRNTTDMMTRGW